MGWSCTQLAGDVMNRIMDLSHQSDKKALIKGTDGRYYFIEWSNREYEDGHITGSVFMAVQSVPPYAPLRPEDDDSRFRAKKIGGLDISPCGEIRKLPRVISGLLRGAVQRNPKKEGAMKRKEPKEIRTREQARDAAQEWQQWASGQNLSYGELFEYQNYFRKLGKKFGLMREFKENGII